MSLESKAKSYREVYRLWREAWKKTVDGVPNPLLDQKWVRIEDAQQEIARLERMYDQLGNWHDKLFKERNNLRDRLEKLRKLVEEWTSLDDAEQLRREVEKWVEEASG